MRNWPSIFVIGLVVLAGIPFISCDPGDIKRNNTHSETDLSSIRKGKILAAQYCQSCHQLPDPALLDAGSWEKGVLPHMGPLLGINYYNGKTYPADRNDRYLFKNYYPSVPMLKPEEWGHIIDYYTATSPDSLPGQQRPGPIDSGGTPFEVIVPKVYAGSPPTTCMVQVDTSSKTHTLLVADAILKRVVRWSARLDRLDSIECGGPVVNVDYAKDAAVLTNIGVLNPTNGKYGRGQRYVQHSGRMHLDSPALFDNLARPVQITVADLNGDGRPDYLVCEFGYMTGALSWMENKGDSGFVRHIIRQIPGAIKAYINDYNHDGRPDLWVLFAQAEEGIFHFTNKGGGEFSAEEVLRFPPAYGSSYFELTDINKDGYPDIIYTCGDNADFSPVLKPYHGVYIFLNDGKDHFVQRYFYPINGCYKAIARDFDGDGDIDIAAISFFADYNRQPGEGFIYLENQGNLQFKAHTLPGSRVGRWLTMDAADLDGDGRIDIILGNFSVAPQMIKSGIDWKKGPPFLFLKNIGKTN